MIEGTQPIFSELVCDPTKEISFRTESEASQRDVCLNLNRNTHQDKPKYASPFLVILTAEQARAIYRLRSASTAEGGTHAKSVAGKSSLVAEMFGVSPKTIRDVWNRKTWTQVSHGLSFQTNIFENL